MNALAAAVVSGLFLLILVIVLRLFVALLRAGVPTWLAALGAAALLPVIAASGAFAISRFGEVGLGTVTAKNEVLEVSDQGLTPDVEHRLIVSVASAELRRARQNSASTNPLFQKVRVTADLDFEVGEKRYDALSVGDRVSLREFRWKGLQIARFQDEPWWNIAPARLERLLPDWAARGDDFIASAQVMAVRTMHQALAISLLRTSGDGGVPTDLQQPYDEVRIQFTARSGARILTLDRIDAGSAGRLEPGMLVQVYYPSDRPRSARLAAGRRDFQVRNALAYWGEDIAGFLAAIVATLIVFWVARRYRGARTPR